MTAPVDFRALAATGRIHFVGVGGAGMAPLAEMVLRSGGAVSGCDLVASRRVRALADLGMEFMEGHDPSHVEGAALVVITSAMPAGHPELLAARSGGIPVMKRAEALGQWVNHGRVVGIAGTHGKTTTTAMATHVLVQAGVDPTGVVGGEVSEWGGNLRPGGSDVYVVEADEYDRSFHTLRPEVAVVTNLEADHLDVYGDLAGVRASFLEFVAGVGPGGTLWVCSDDSEAARVGVAGGPRTRTYGLSAGSQLRAIDVRHNGAGSHFTVVEDGVRAADLTVSLPGLHNVRNALAAVGVGRSFGADWPQIAKGLSAFGGVGRRYDVLGSSGGITVIDDYAHHPTEISATLDAVRRANPGQRVVAVFQPHLYTRTRDFHVDFGTALEAADVVWVTDVYPAREKPIPGVTGATVADAIGGATTRTQYHPDLGSLAKAVSSDLETDDVCVVMGAGSIERTGPEILSILEERFHA